VERMGIRVVIHPDQFVVLTSERRDVVRTSIRILCKQALAMDLMGLPQSAWSTLIVHGGKAGRGEFLTRLIPRLPVEVRSRLSLENDEHAYSAAEIYDVCRRAQVPMVFDNLHHLVRERLDSHEDPSLTTWVARARTTWPEPGWQIVHLSNGQDHLHDERHSHLIQHVPSAYRGVRWIEVEAKGKEQAIEGLRRQLEHRR
jgi:UV DNA damage endonuclease